MSDSKSESSDAALQARLNQLEVENRMRHRFNSISSGAEPFKHTPRKGFGSAQGIAHLRHTEYQRRGPSPPPPPPAIPEPGQAKFGGTYMRTPLPGVISGEVEHPWEEMIAPVPVRPPSDKSASQPGVAETPPAERLNLSPPPAPQPSPQAVAQPRPPQAPQPSPAQAAGGPAVAPPFDPGGKKVIGAGGLAKAPLPEIYHAGMRAAERAGQCDLAGSPLDAVAPTGPIAVPQDAEVRTDEPVKTPQRVKRFKNPTLNPPEKS